MKTQNAMDRIIMRAINDFRIGIPKNAQFIGQPMENTKNRDTSNAHYWTQTQETEVMGIRGFIVADAWDYLNRNFERLDKYEVEQMLVEKRALFVTSYPIHLLEPEDHRKEVFYNHIPYVVINDRYRSLQRMHEMLSRLFGLVAITAIDAHGASYREDVLPQCRLEEWVASLHRDYPDAELRLFLHPITIGTVYAIADERKDRFYEFDWKHVISPSGRITRIGERAEIFNHFGNAVARLFHTLFSGAKWGKPGADRIPSEEEIIFEKMIAGYVEKAFSEHMEAME